MSASTKIIAPNDEHGVYNLSGRAVFGDVAHVPGHSPPETFCRSCVAIRHASNASVWGKCAKAAQLRNLEVEDIGFIQLDTAACKYYVLRTKEHAKPWIGWAACQPPEPVEETAQAE